MTDVVGRLNAALEGRYAIEHEVGEGGMATVYVASDLKHNRKVAVKVLRPELAAVVGAERFLAEIETTANLQHPHILPLFDSGEADGFLFYVMPYVEGESLRDRLKSEHQLPVDESVQIAKKVASALDYAHEQGVVHRDVKPANILLSRGEPVVADFGIALAVSAAGGGRLTETGLSLGTPHYMSPEQATGEERVGPPADVYALACVLYEMLVGQPPYTGGTAQAVLGKIITGDPDPVTTHRKAVPPNVDAAIRRALEKLPADRFHSASAFAAALVDAGFTYGPPTGATSGGGRAGGERPWKIAAGAFAVSTLVLGISILRGGGDDAAEVLRYEMSLPVEVGANSDYGSNLAISPDGRRIVYSGMAEGAEAPGLWVRDRSRLEPVELPGTALGVHPTFSPDGMRVAFISDDRALKVASVTGRPPVTLHQSPRLRRGGLSWGDDGYIYFAQWMGDEGLPASLYRVPESGGEIERVTRVDSTRSEVAHYFPDVLPGSEWILFAAARVSQYDASTRDVAIANVETGEVTLLLQGIQAVWSETGHVLAVRADGALVSATLDLETLEVGPATPVFEGVQVESLVSADISISENGTLVYIPGASLDEQGRQPFWIDRDGLATPVDPSWTGRLNSPRISPDGSSVAIERAEVGGERHVWVKEIDTGPESKLTFQGTVNDRPVWTPDGSAVAFVSNRGENGNGDVHRRRADGATPTTLELDAEDVIEEVEYSGDGGWVVVRVDDDIYVRSTEPGSELEPLIADPGALERNFAISPDSRWIAYVSDESGESMVYVRPFPNTNDGKFTVSLRSSVSPRWAPDGNELFYRTIDGDFVAVEIIPGNTFIVGQRTTLFPFSGFAADNNHAQYDVHPDRDRFLMIQLGDPSMRSRVVVVENFTEELLAAMGG